jgi:hypothetical protein
MNSDLKVQLIMWPVLAMLGLAMASLIYMIHTALPNTGATYNCALAEISPDFTTKMREECRKLRAKQ